MPQIEPRLLRPMTARVAPEEFAMAVSKVGFRDRLIVLAGRDGNWRPALPSR
jgi:hypothetical protein